MKNSKDNKLKAFIFFFWSREVSGNSLTNNEKRLLKIWEEDSLLELDEEHYKNTKRQILLNIRQKSNLNPKVNSYYTIKKIRKLVFVAVLLLLISIGGVVSYTNYFQPDVYIAKSSSRKVMLKDGSVVTLLSGAELTVEKTFPADTRLVSLKGDAIFSVAKSKVHPFVVKAENFTTKVLGTVFKISQSGTDKSVELYEGKVAVKYAGTRDSYLSPSQTWTNFGLARTAVIYSKKIDNTSGRQITKIKSLSFNEVPFSKIIEAVKKHYNIDIRYPAEIGDKKISAELKGTVDENIDALAFAVGLEVEKGNTNIYTLKK